MKLRLHVYLCRKCGTAYKNEQDRTGGWFRTWSLPDRSRVHSLHVPPCEPGAATARRLEHYAPAIVCYGK